MLCKVSPYLSSLLITSTANDLSTFFAPTVFFQKVNATSMSTFRKQDTEEKTEQIFQ